MQHDPQNSQIAMLVDMLANYTEEYTRMIHQQPTEFERFMQCKNTIAILQAEIFSRKIRSGNLGGIDVNFLSGTSH
jgi:hypothetical protein